MEGLKDENGEGQLAFEPYELFRFVLTTTHLIAEMAAVSILHVEEFPPLYHRRSEVRGVLRICSSKGVQRGCPELFNLEMRLAGAMYIHKPIPVYLELEPWPASDRGLPRLSALT